MTPSPCPLCGGPAFCLRDLFTFEPVVSCLDCHLQLRGLSFGRKQVLIERWNYRPPLVGRRPEEVTR